MVNWPIIIAVGSGGAIGSVLRLLINGFMSRHFVHTLPFGTLAVNLLGSLLIGTLFAWFHLNASISPQTKSFLVTGLLGGLTTYSTFAIESFFLLESSQYGHAFANMALNLFGTILMVAIGYLGILHLFR